MSAVHLGVVELEGDGERCLPPALSVLAPHDHGVAEFLGVLIDYRVKFCLNHGRSSHHHIVVKERTLRCSGHLMRKFVIFFYKGEEIIYAGDVARTDSPLRIVDNNIYGQIVKVEKFSIFW